MEKLKAGLYIANGQKISVLVRIVGEAPMLNIVSGVLLNDMQRDGTVTVLDRNSIEIQSILANPDKYVFNLPCVSEAIYNEKGLDDDNTNPEFANETFREWVEQYKDQIRMYPTNYIIKMQAILIKEGYSRSQSDLIIRQIQSYIKRNE